MDGKRSDSVWEGFARPNGSAPRVALDEQNSLYEPRDYKTKVGHLFYYETRGIWKHRFASTHNHFIFCDGVSMITCHLWEQAGGDGW